MAKTLPKHRIASRIWATYRRFIRIPHSCRFANRANFRNLEFLRSCRALIPYNRHHLGNDISGALNNDRVTHTHIFFIYFILVVESCARYFDTANPYRLQNGNGRKNACSPNLNDNILDNCVLLFGGKLISNRPSRRPGSISKVSLEFK